MTGLCECGCGKPTRTPRYNYWAPERKGRPNRFIHGHGARLGAGKPFWGRIKKTPTCWIWTGAIQGDGYGSLMFLRQQWKAHRLAWVKLFGPIPSGLCVLHKCDNPACVNPAHLFLGTQADNVKDCVNKGRARGGPNPGIKNGMAKLTESQVKEIRSLYAGGGISQYTLGKQFGVKQCTIWSIVRGKHWSHVR